MVRRILFAFCRGIGASVGLGGVSLVRPTGQSDGTATKDESDLDEAFVSSLHRSTRHVRVGANIVPFLSKPQRRDPLENSQDCLSRCRH